MIRSNSHRPRSIAHPTCVGCRCGAFTSELYCSISLWGGSSQRCLAEAYSCHAMGIIWRGDGDKGMVTGASTLASLPPHMVKQDEFAYPQEVPGSPLPASDLAFPLGYSPYSPRGKRYEWPESSMDWHRRGVCAAIVAS